MNCPDVRIFTTGGTIDKIYFDSSSEYSVGQPQIEAILAQAGVVVQYEVRVLLRKDSLDMTDEDRVLIRRAVVADSCNRVLITHGTDSMIETARALEGIEGKVVVLVGSLSPARFKGTDAEFNIGFALGGVQALPPGIHIAMNGRFFHPDQVRKNKEQNRFEKLDPDHD